MHTFLYLFVILLSFSFKVDAEDKAKMLQDLDMIQSIFESRYAPYEWKKSYLGWSLEEEIVKAKIKILGLHSLTVKDYQKILHAFFISACDYHVQDEYYSTEFAILPFKIKGAEGKYYITKIDKELFGYMQESGFYKSKILPKIGDEIVLFDSKPVQDVLEEIKFHDLGNPSSRTAQRLSEEILTNRLGNRAHRVPSGSVTIALKRDKKIFDVEMEWLYMPEKIDDRIYEDTRPPLADLLYKSKKSDRNSRALINEPEEFYHAANSEKPKMMINSLAHDLKKDRTGTFKRHFVQLLQARADRESENLVDDPDSEPTMKKNAPIDRESILFGRKVWEESPKTPFKVHIFKLPETEKRIGYIRMQTYAPSTDDKTVCQLTTRLAKSIRYLEQNTDALVVDQIDNAGGIDLYAFAFLGMLTDRPLKLPVNRVKITQREIAKAFKVIEMYSTIADSPETHESPVPSLLYGYPYDDRFRNCEMEFQSFLISQWNEGKSMTDPFPMHGIDALPPHTLAKYSKPILMLVNSNDFSCGDFVPAILQDNRRAVIFGEETAGAGGVVEFYSYPNNFGLSEFSYTVSIAERTSGPVIENLGVTPDEPYNLTQADLLYGYRDYIKAVTTTLKKMLTTNAPVK